MVILIKQLNHSLLATAKSTSENICFIHVYIKLYNQRQQMKGMYKETLMKYWCDENMFILTRSYMSTQESKITKTYINIKICI